MLKEVKKLLIPALLLAGFFLLTRLYRLGENPLFTDEAIYLRWAQIAKNDANWRFISLTDGKQPLLIWAAMITLRFFKDPLFAGRLVSVFCGLGSLTGLFFLGRELFGSSRLGLLSASLYLFYPFALVYDRMMLMDGMVGLFAVWAIYLEVLLVKTLRLDVALILGMVLGAGMLTKSSAFFSLYLLPLSLLLFDWHQKNRSKKLAAWLGLAIIAAVQSQLIYNVLRLSPFFHMVAEKNVVFIYSFEEWLTHPTRFLEGNLKGMANWFLGYFSLPITLLLLITVAYHRKHWQKNLLLVAWFALPFFALALFGKVLYPRFIFFMTLTLLPIVALGLDTIYGKIKHPVVYTVLICCLSLIWVRTDWLYLTDPYRAPIPKSDSIQYFNDWPAGGGINQTVAFLTNQTRSGQAFVGTEGTFGLLPYGLEIYLQQNSDITIKGYWPIPSQIPEELLAMARTRPTFFVFNQLQNPPQDWPLKLIARHQKGIGDKYLSLYRIVPEND